MTNIETETRKFAKQFGGARQGSHPSGDRDPVSVVAGRVARKCAAVADAGGLLPEMERELPDAIDGHDTPIDRWFAAALARLCANVAALSPSAPGDAIRDAFVWTGWCHDVRHGSGSAVRARLHGESSLGADSREDLQAALDRILLPELVTPEAVEAAFKASRQSGPDSYWARAWRLARAAAMAEVFPNGLPPGIQMRLVLRRAPR